MAKKTMKRCNNNNKEPNRVIAVQLAAPGNVRRGKESKRRRNETFLWIHDGTYPQIGDWPSDVTAAHLRRDWRRGRRHRRRLARFHLRIIKIKTS